MPDHEEIDNLIRAIKSENWAYVNRRLPGLKHVEQFLLLSQLPTGIQEDVHHFLFDHVQYLRKEEYEAQYACDTLVTLLRAKGLYVDVKSDTDTNETRDHIKKVIEETYPCQEQDKH